MFISSASNFSALLHTRTRLIGPSNLENNPMQRVANVGANPCELAKCHGDTEAESHDEIIASNKIEFEAK